VKQFLKKYNGGDRSVDWMEVDLNARL